MINKIYYWFHRLTSKTEQRGQYSAGHWQEKVRQEALSLCRDTKGRVLDVGCGEGLFLVQLKAQNPVLEIWGIDNNALRIEEAKRKCKEKDFQNINLTLEDSSKLNFEDEYFDTIVCINVFFNLRSFALVKQTLQELKRVCKKTGRIIFDFRNRNNPLLLFKYSLARFYDSTVKDLPLKTYSPGQIQSLLKDLGLEIVEKKFIGSPLKNFAAVIVLEVRRQC
ncbi:MAG: class I SAM-dependent methyltransferase [Candidatus Omnitrophica bacterium]|nr:class I SAM-dependent methyltransferase [Candidatus Omnitrophota bacterium]MDD5238075.1 class I SAM-dependent methyltransferase [Candidatus Omnitrophota bacterium]